MIRRYTRRASPEHSSLRAAPAPIEDPDPVGTRSGCLYVRLCDSFPPSFPRVSHLPYLLPSSVSRNPFVCHSYENCRGVYQQFPFRNGFTTGDPSMFKRSNLWTFNVFPTYLLFFQTCAHSFALMKNSTLFFSIDSALFAKNHPGWGVPPYFD